MAKDNNMMYAAGAFVVIVIIALAYKYTQDPCKGFTDTTPASQITPKCLQQVFLQAGCSKKGTAYPADNYNGWWLQDNGAKTFAGIKKDIKAWATLQDDKRKKGCYGPSA